MQAIKNGISGKPSPVDLGQTGKGRAVTPRRNPSHFPLPTSLPCLATERHSRPLSVLTKSIFCVCSCVRALLLVLRQSCEELMW